MIEFTVYIEEGLYTPGKNEYLNLMLLLEEYGSYYVKQIPKKSIKYLTKISFELSHQQKIQIGIEPYQDIPVLHIFFPIKEFTAEDTDKTKMLTAIHTALLEAAHKFNWDTEIFSQAFEKVLSS